MKENELNVFSGTHIFKTSLEYFNDNMFIHGYPYYMINEVDNVYYLWELDRANPDSRKYLLMKHDDVFIPLYEEAVALEKKLMRQLYPETWIPSISEPDKELKP